MAAEEEDFSQLSIEDKVTHKSWRARSLGYEEATKMFKRIDDEKSPEFGPYLNLLKKFVTDSNVMAQEKALEATLALVEYAAAAPKVCGEVVPGLVAKAFNGRPKTKQFAFDICLTFIEIEKQDVVQEEVRVGLTNKQPKIVAASLELLTLALREFGARVMDAKQLMKTIPAQLEHKDKNVREAAKGLAVEMYRWLGPALKSSLEGSLKPVLMKEIEEECGKLPSTVAVPQRLLRSQQKKQASVPVPAAGGGEDQEEVDGGEDSVGAVQVQGIDPYDLLDPVDVLAQMPKDFYDNMGESKWSIRKEALEAILPLASKPKLAQGDYNELIKTLNKVITKDSNVLVVALAANVVKGLAVGLREGFQSLVPQVLPGMLGKFKEKKLGVVTALREAVDAVYLTTSFSSMEENVIASLGDKNPSVKAETALFLARCFQQCTPPLMPKPLLNNFCPPLIQCLHDVPAVREAAAEALGTALKVVGERGMAAYLDGLESLKMGKVTEFKDKVELRPPQGIHAKAAMKKGGGEAAPVKKTAKAKKEEKEDKGEDGSAAPPPKPKKKKKQTTKKEPAKDEAKTASAPTESKPASKSGAKKTSGGSKTSGGGGKGKGKSGGGGVGMGDAPDPPEAAITDEEVAELAEALLPGRVRTGLASSKWQERLEAHEEIKKMIEGMPAEEVQSLLLVKILGMKPGWKETMFQVMKAKIAVVAAVAGRAKVCGRKTVSTVLPTIVDKLGDAKIKAQSCETLMAVAEKMTLNYISLQTLKHAFGQKNPKVQSESLEWLGQAVREFGLLINIKPHVDYVNKAFDSTNPAVRGAAISLLGVMRMYVGAQLRVFFEDAKPALLQQIDAVFEKASDESPPAPVRGPNCKTEDDESEEEDAGEEEGGGAVGGPGGKEPQMSLADLMPKVDISPQITSSLVSDLADKNWKVRGEALQKVTEILAAAKFIESSLGDLPGALKGRLGDSNKNLIITTLNIITTLANAMGSSCGRHARTLLPGSFGILADAKPQLRAAALTTLNAWYDQIGLAPLVEAETISTALATENPNLRSELLQWLAEKLPEAGKLPSEFSSFVPPLLSCLEDRSGEVRKHSQTVLPLVMVRVGYDAMLRQASKLKPASKQVIIGLLEKHKASLPPPKSAKAKATSAAKEKTESKDTADSPPAAAKETKTAKTGKAGSKTAGKKGASKKGKEADEDVGPPLTRGPTMQQRQKDEQNFKVLKWSFSTPRSEFIDQLKDQMQPCVSRPLLTQLFHDDFKHHIAALGTLKECVSGSAQYGAEAIACMDLLLKWVTLRFCDTNTTVNLKCLEFLSTLFALLIKERYRMSDFEATSFLPFLVIKSGDAKDAVRKEVRALFDQICCFYAPPKLFGYVADGLKSKNSRQRFECLEMLGVLVQNNGLVVCQPSPQKAVQQIAPFVGEKDSSVRNAALNTLVIFYENMGDAMYKHVGKLPHKDLSMLEERIRRSAKKSSPETNTTITLQEKQSSPNSKGEREGEGEDQHPQQKGGVKGATSKTRLAVDPEATVIKEPSPVPPPPAAEELEPEAAPPPTASPPKRSAIPVPDGPLKMDFSKYRYPAAPVLKLAKLPAVKQEDLLEDFEVPQYETSKLLANPPPSLTFSPSRMATTSAAISFIVSQIASSDQQACISALRQMDQILSKTEHTATVKLNVDQLLRAILMQMRMNFNTQLQQANSPGSLKQVMLLGKRLTSCLLNTFSQPELAAAASQDTLVETERDVMTLLQDERMLRLEDVAQLNRSFNFLMLKVVENGEKNALFGSLLHVMLESLGQDGNPSKLTEMAMKCIWKLTRQLSQFLPQINVDQLLLNVHHFFTGYNDRTAGGRVQDDTPFRTVKTILFHLVTIMGDSVLDHLTMVEDSRQSAMYKYLCKTIAKKRLSGEGVAPQMKTPPKEGLREGATRVQPKRPPQLVLVDIPDEVATPLADALDKTRDRSLETQREGFRELYALTEKHPSFDLHAFVASNTLPQYQSWVKRGLKAVEYERQCKAQNKKPLADRFQNMLYSDELKASMEKYKEERKQLEMRGIVLTRNNPTGTDACKDNPSAAAGSKLAKKLPRPAAPGSENSTAPAPSHPPTSSASGGQEGQDMSKFNLGSLMQRLNKLKGTT